MTLVTTVSGHGRLLPDLMADLEEWPPSPRKRRPLPGFFEADAQKVAPHVIEVLSRTSGLPCALEEKWAAIKLKQAVLGSEALAITEAARASGSRILFLRGFSLRPYYPDSYLRQFNDLDLVVASEEELGRLLGALGQRGYFFSRPAVAIRRGCAGDAPAPWMLFSLNARHQDLSEPVMVDVALEGPSITSVSQLPLPASLFDAPNRVAVGSGQVPVPDTLHCLLVLIAEMYERRAFTLRDLLDIDRVLSAIDDPAEVASCLTRLRLAAQVERLAVVAGKWGARELAWRLRALAPARRLRRRRGPFCVHLRHMLPRAWEDSPGTAVLRLSLSLATPAVGWLEDRAPAVALGLWRRLPPSHGYRLGLPTYLFPLASTLDVPSSPSLRFPDTSRRERFVACGRVFLARCRPLVEEAELGDLEDTFHAG